METKKVPAAAKKTFDTRVHIRDPKTGLVIRENHYVMRVSADQGTSFIRDNKEYHPNGELKRDLGPQTVAPVQNVESAPAAKTAEEVELGVPSAAELMKSASKGEIRRSK